MTNNTCIDVYSALAGSGVSYEALSHLMDPSRDPALVMPTFPVEQEVSATCESVPTIDYIEDALNDHVRGGKAPDGLIRSLFGPFKEELGYISLEPGKGQKRPSYAIKISCGSLEFARASTRIIAETLHDIAIELSHLPVGKNAPKDAPIVHITLPRKSMALRAQSLKAVRMACLVAFRRQPEEIGIELKATADQIAQHVLAAREILKEEVIGLPRYRQQGIEIIQACEDIRLIATTALRRNTAVWKNQMHWISIRPNRTPMIDIQKDGFDDSSAHARVQKTAMYRDLIEGLQSVVAQHPVLSSLPEKIEVSLYGDSKFFFVELVDSSINHASVERKISNTIIEYGKLNELAERLEKLDGGKSAPDANWTLSLSEWSRSSMQWSFSGPTLSHAIADAVKSRGDKSSMLLFDLLIDLIGDEDGNPITVDLRRIIS